MSESIFVALIVFGAMFALTIVGLVWYNAQARRLNATTPGADAGRPVIYRAEGLSSRTQQLLNMPPR